MVLHDPATDPLQEKTQSVKNPYVRYTRCESENGTQMGLRERGYRGGVPDLSRWVRGDTFVGAPSATNEVSNATASSPGLISKVPSFSKSPAVAS
jgi:hypothetical protein